MPRVAVSTTQVVNEEMGGLYIFCTKEETEKIANAVGTGRPWLSIFKYAVSPLVYHGIKAYAWFIERKARRCIENGNSLLIVWMALIPTLHEYDPDDPLKSGWYGPYSKT